MAYTKKNPMLNKGDAVYGEHFNNSALLAGMFSMIGQVNIPYQFEAGLFNTTGTPEKALFLRITLEKLTGTNNGDSIILDTGQSFTLNTKVVLSLFKSWKRLNITGTTVDVEIGLYDENDNLIRTVTNNQELTNFNITDESIKVVITAKSSCTISNVLFEVTTSKWDNNSTVTIPQEQITGLKEWETAKDKEINNIFDMMYPVGIIIEMDNNIDPNSSMKGTWELFAKGQTTVGRNPNDADFNTIGKSGGAKTHTLTVNEMPSHTHTQNAHTHAQNAHTHSQSSHTHQPSSNSDVQFVVVDTTNASSGLVSSSSASALMGRYGVRNITQATPSINNATPTNQNTTATNQSTGGGAVHNNMPPYVVVNKWKRLK
jgi:microcystin-dependent protein